jgi:hypothetical protein
MSLHDVLDMRHRAQCQARKDTRSSIMLTLPSKGVDNVENGQQGERPANVIDNRLFAVLKELVYNEPKQQRVDERPDCRRVRPKRKI